MDIAPGLRMLAAIATCHSWSTRQDCRERAGSTDYKAVPRLIAAGHVLQLPSGALHPTSAGRRLIRTAGIETVACAKCRQEFQRDAFRQANRWQCRRCNPTAWVKGVRRAA